MALGIRGKLTKGEECKIIQWSNDWFMVDIEIVIDERLQILGPIIVSPLSLQLNKDEMNRWLDDPAGMECEYALDLETGRFKRR